MNKSMFKFRGIQIFAAITADAIREAIKDLKTPEEIQAKLIELGTVKIETKEVVKEHTKESVDAFITQNKEYADSLYNSNVKNYLAQKLGKKADEITDDEIKAELVTKIKLDEEVGKYNNRLVENEIEKHLGSNYELLKPHIKLDTIKIDADFKIVGLEEQITSLKTNYPDLFKAKEDGKPGDGTGGGKGILTEDNPWSKEHWDENKQINLFQTNKELAEKFMNETGYNY
ncbi:phage scaffolding protein [Cetobacterium sp. 2A]|uniref:phage scaffolding protein n=1 Tax=Cetobacterium sp. 2A TaxID=2754723 RepID=UPI00163D206A|nr:phage scaffolding protein [Cetobacterium sp. 2A]MBC2855475.1 phage scaffolding protein [Cetobacterium sp. 2A]